MEKKRKYITWTKRLKLEQCYNAGLKVKDIAANIEMSEQTVYRELKRGACVQRYKVYDRYGDFRYKERTSYSADIAQTQYVRNMTSKGAPLKIGHNYELAKYIEKRVVEDKISPHAIAGELKHNKSLFGLSLSKTTLYRYIETGVFPDIVMEHIAHEEKR